MEEKAARSSMRERWTGALVVFYSQFEGLVSVSVSLPASTIDLEHATIIVRPKNIEGKT